MVKQNVVLPIQGNSCWGKATTYWHMDEPHKHPKWMKPDAKEHKLYNSFYMKCQEKQFYKRQKID